MRISDWSSDVCSSDLTRLRRDGIVVPDAQRTPTHAFRVVIAREGEMVTGVEPAMVGVAQAVEFANVDHWPCPFLVASPEHWCSAALICWGQDRDLDRF